MAKKPSIDLHREAIDHIDAKILALLGKRAREVKGIGELKRGTKAPIRVPEREHKILSRLKALNKGPYPDHAIESIYREILSASISLEAPIRVAFLGPEGTFSHQAALTAFGHSVEMRPQAEFRQIFEEVRKGNADYGIVPVENSIEGMVYQNLDLLTSTDMLICAEFCLPVEHCLLTGATDISKIKKIYSHPQPWGQCALWLESHGFDTRHLEEVGSTAKAAALAKQKPLSTAAIASREAARLYGLPVFKSGIQDSQKNETRFVVIGFDKPGPTGRDKTTVIFSARDEVGFLANILKDLADANINLTKIESRPSRVRDWDYIFCVEMEGHIAEERIQKALARIEARCPFFRHIGSYPIQKNGKPYDRK